MEEKHNPLNKRHHNIYSVGTCIYIEGTCHTCNGDYGHGGEDGTVVL